MRRLLSIACATALAATATFTATTTSASAAVEPWTYSGSSGATKINALGTTISSGTTAASSLSGTEVPNSAATGVAGVKVGTLAVVGAITGGQSVSRTLGGVKLTSVSSIAKVSLLNGAIKADALETTSYAQSSILGLAGDTATKLVHLTIGGQLIPVDVGTNTKISIPGIADVVINERHNVSGPGSVLSYGAALHVTLLKANSGAPAGAEIVVNPTSAQLFPTPDSNAAPLAGDAYSLYAEAHVGSSVKVLSQPTGKASLPQGGTNGFPYTTAVASAKIPKVLTLGALENTVNGTTIPGAADATAESEIAKVNLLNGLIKADAIDVVAHVRTSPLDNVSEARLNLVHLVIAGKKIPIDVKPNTVINIAGIAKVYLNQQVTTPGAAGIIGLRVVLSTAKFGLPIGADIQVAAAGVKIG